MHLHSFYLANFMCMFILLIYVFIIILFLSGQEWENVILSTVRSLPAHKVEVKSTTKWKNQHLGHLVNQGKVNLALTRAKKRLIILGEIGKHVKNSYVCRDVPGRIKCSTLF